MYANFTIFVKIFIQKKMEALRSLNNIPINSAVLKAFMSNLKYPKNKISNLEKNGTLIRLKKDLYVVSDKITHKSLSRELIANHLYGPSYVSFQTALAFYGLIPERVFAMRSAIFKRTKRFENAVGNFEYITVPQNYYPIGITQQTVDNEYIYMLASPEKALCDLILTTNHLRLQSVKAMREYLEEDLRFETSALTAFNADIVEECLKFGKKKTELMQLLKLLS